MRIWKPLPYLLSVLFIFSFSAWASINPSNLSNVAKAWPEPSLQPLATAIAKGQRNEILKFAKNVDLSSHGDKNVTFLEWAIFNRSTVALEALLDAGADPALQGMDGDTALHLAAMVNDGKYMNVFIRKGVNLDVEDTSGRTPLFPAILHQRQEQIDALIQAGANIHHRDHSGNTLLHQASQGSPRNMALELLKLGVDPTLKNVQRATFQSHFFMSREELLNATGKRNRQEVRDFLKNKGIPLEK